MYRLRKIAKFLVPSLQLRNKLKALGDLFLIHTAPLRHRLALRRLKGKPKIRVAFFVINGAIWKLDGLFRRMAEDDRFDPLIVVCPYTPFGGRVMQEWMNEAFSLFTSKKYDVIRALDPETGKWLDVKREINPDIIFFTNPHHLTRDEYYIRNYPYYLSCYVPYAFMIPNTYYEQFDQFFHNAVWRSFYETPIHKEIAKKHARNRGRNVIVTGYPGCDPFVDKSYKPSDPWKIKEGKIKRIIWAPHHLMKEELRPSNFLGYHQIMLDLAVRYRDKIQIAFKPHPILKPKLYGYPEWGEDRANRYFREWENMENAQLEEGDYTDLFLTSDALIHDCGSFITEYLFTGKPELYMISNDKVSEGWNEYGEKVLNVIYQSRKEDDLHSFIDGVVIGGHDPMKEVRMNFLNVVVMPPNNLTASENIFNHLLKEINR